MMPAVIAARIGVDRRMNLPVFAAELLRPGFAPSLQDDFERLHHHVVAGRTINAEHDLVAHGGAGAEAEIDAGPRAMWSSWASWAARVSGWFW